LGPPEPLNGLRVVLDTNVVLSALLFPAGRLVWLRRAWQTGAVRPIVNRDTVMELLAVLAYPKFRLSPSDRDELLADLLPWCETVVLDPVPPVPDCRDPADRPFLELAIGGNAVSLVTGDRDLLALADISPVPILAPGDLRLRLGA
jgi:uncharacterized protein